MFLYSPFQAPEIFKIYFGIVRENKIKNLIA